MKKSKVGGEKEDTPRAAKAQNQSGLISPELRSSGRRRQFDGGRRLLERIVALDIGGCEFPDHDLLQNGQLSDLLADRAGHHQAAETRSNRCR